MTINDRSLAARFYDYNPNIPDDILFYINQIRSRDQSILELGCGTGRVLLPLSSHCGYIHGIDKSDTMISICRDKLNIAGIPKTKAQVEVADITSFNLGKKFDLIIAPFRVFQNLETEKEVSGLFKGVRSHLKDNGSCIINVFRPFGSRDEIIRSWSSPDETIDWEVPYEDGKLACSNRKTRIDITNMILYPELIYRIYQENKLAEEERLQIAMKCYWPEELINLIESYRFRIRAQWGGYNNEEYGKGPELVIEIEKN
jgi:SAM-dependent methyltransferase